MFSIEQVFVPVDFSRSSRLALRLARALGQAEGRPPRLRLAHVVERWPPYMHEVLFPYAALGEDEVEFEHELIERARQMLGEHLELEALDEDEDLLGPLQARVGLARQVLPELLASSGAELVVMGAFGAGGPVPESLGSTAARLLRASTRPVLLARELGPPRLSRVLCALDLTPSCVEVLQVAMGVAIAAGAELECLFVLPDPFDHDPTGLLRGHLDFDRGRVLERERPKIDALFERAREGVEVPFAHQEAAQDLWRQRAVRVGDPAATIVGRAEAVGADLIVLGSHNLQGAQAGQLGRVAWTVTRTCTTHALVVPIAQQANLLDEDSAR